MIKVAGNSFITSTNKSIPAVSKPPHNKGVCTLYKIPGVFSPRLRAASSRLGLIFRRLVSMVLRDTAKNRTI